MGEKGSIYQRTTKGRYFFWAYLRIIFFTPCPVGVFVLDIGSIAGSPSISILWHHEIDSVDYACDRENLKMDLTEVARTSSTSLTLLQPDNIWSWNHLHCYKSTNIHCKSVGRNARVRGQSFSCFLDTKNKLSLFFFFFLIINPQ
jgi:hypothetical protein